MSIAAAVASRKWRRKWATEVVVMMMLTRSDGDQKKKNKKEALMALTEAGWQVEINRACYFPVGRWVPKDLQTAIEDGRIPGSIVLRYFELREISIIGMNCFVLEVLGAAIGR
ncbi:hypothetical protein HAX54_036626 [Datura stramonium]|uniref:Uncharacterized protein n=1 Tax=Datura stramonium TaxID=4076 RepID=A0ABS8VH54_DATST|nr:hypothetical protein [Datura stramonium]